MTSAVVQLNEVSRTFGTVTALHQVTIVVPPCSITVLLGPNGAGKTTTIRLITGALEPDSGSVVVFDHDPAGPEGEEIRRRCGVVSAKPSLYDRLDGRDNLRYAAELYGLGRGPRREQRINETAEQFGIIESLHQRVGGYSTGMKTRLALARSILHQPDLLLLDEPTSGLDPEAAVAVLELIKTMPTKDRTVVMCTHLLSEAEGLADQVVVMGEGAAMVSGSRTELIHRFWPDPLVNIRAERGEDLDKLAVADGVLRYDREGDRATLALDSTDRVADLILALSDRGVRLVAVEPYQPNLEDIYFAVRASSRQPEIRPAPAASLPVGAAR